MNYLPAGRSHSRIAFGPVIFSVLGSAFFGAAFATDAASDSCKDASTFGFAALGAAFGYFLTYSIRHGSKTQDVFKSFFGALGATGGAATTLVVPEACRTSLLMSYGTGVVLGFGVFCLLAFLLALHYSRYFTAKGTPTGAALFSETLAKVLLGEDFRPPPPPEPRTLPGKSPPAE